MDELGGLIRFLDINFSLKLNMVAVVVGFLLNFRDRVVGILLVPNFVIIFLFLPSECHFHPPPPPHFLKEKIHCLMNFDSLSEL